MWLPMTLLVCISMICLGMFETQKLSTHLLSSPCTIVKSELSDVGTCTLCDYSVPSNCQVHPIATARILVNFHHQHVEKNITGNVWYCKTSESQDPCQPLVGYLDQFSLDLRELKVSSMPPSAPVPCTTADVMNHVMHAEGKKEATCYYSSRDEHGEAVWLSLPSPGLVDHAWFQDHVEYPVLMALSSLVLLTLLLACLAVEGAELYFSGIV